MAITNSKGFLLYEVSLTPEFIRMQFAEHSYIQTFREPQRTWKPVYVSASRQFWNFDFSQVFVF